MKMPLSILALAWAACAGMLVGAEPVLLSVEDAVTRAQEASLELYGQRLTLGSAQRDLDNGWNLFLPGISAGLSAELGDTLFTEADATGGSTAASPFGTSLSVGTRLTITTGALFDLEKRRSDYSSALLAEREVRTRLVRDVEKAYFSIVSLELDLENKTRGVDLAAERTRLAELRFERGLGSELDKLRAQMSELNARSALGKAIVDHDKRLAAFRRQVGLDAGTPLTLSTPIEIPDSIPAGVQDELIDGRIDLGKAKLAIEAAGSATRRFVASNRLPLLTLDAGWNLGMTDFASLRDNYSLSAALSFNADALLPKSRKDLELRTLRETEARLAVTYEQDRRNARDEVEALLLDISMARSNLDVAGGQVRLAERIHDRTREAWERGSATGLELEDAQLAVDSARQSLIASRYQYLSLLIDLGYALNVDWRTLVR